MTLYDPPVSELRARSLRGRRDLTARSTFETLVATGVVCAGIWALIGLTILGTL